MVQLGKLFKLGQMILHSPETKNCVITWYQRVSTTQGEKGGRGEVSDGVIRRYCSTIPTDLEFKQRQPEVERSQVTMSLKIGQGAYGEVSNWCKTLLGNKLFLH